MIVLVRNDDRLVHGQCMTRIVQHFKLKRIVVIDDNTASNSILKLVCEKAAIGDYKINVYSQNNCMDALKDAATNNLNTMIVFRFPPVAKLVFDAVHESAPKEFMVGPCQVTKDSVEVNTGTFVSKEYGEVFNYLEDKYGVETYFQPVPDMKRVNWKDIKSKF
jgi:D-glucosaminate PTS system EIIB component